MPGFYEIETSNIVRVWKKSNFNSVALLCIIDAI